MKALAHHHRQMFLWAAVSIAALLPLTADASHRGKINREGLTVDLNYPYEQVLTTVKEVAGGKDIYGASEYSGDENISGAELREKSDAFPSSTNQGEAIYKVAASAIAPAHFNDSNDIGTLTVRYLVRRASAVATRLTINAVFIENARHRRHESDGTVETSEFTEIYNRLKSVDQARAAAEKEQEDRSEDEKVLALQHELDQEHAQLSTEIASVNELRLRYEELARKARVRIVVDSAQLKSGPFAEAKSEATLPKNVTVTLLERTPYWCKVKTADHAEGWIYYLDVGPMP